MATGPVSLCLLVAVSVAAVWLLWRSGPVLTGRPCHAARFILPKWPSSGQAFLKELHGATEPCPLVDNPERLFVADWIQTVACPV